MPILIACEECGKRFRFPDDKAGSTVECKECGADIEIPGGRRGGKKKRKQGGSGLMIGLLVGGGVGVFALLGIVAFVAIRLLQPAAPANNGAANNGQAVAGNPAVPGQNNGVNPAVPGNPAIPPVFGGAPNPAVPGAPANPGANPGVNPPNAAPAGGGGFQTAAQTQGFKPVQNWKVTVDPTTLELPKDSKPFNIKTAAGYIQQNLVAYPDTPSPFILVTQGGNRNESREVWNLFTGEKGGALKGGRISSVGDMGFSPDGNYIGWFRHEGTGGGIEVYDIAAKKSLGAVPVDSAKLNVARVCLPTSKRLVALSNVHRSVHTWAIPSGKVEHEIKLGQNGQPEPGYAFSPGGRFLAVQADFLTRALDIYDLDNGQKAGSIEFAARGPDLFGMAFSRDGKEFAAAYGSPFSDKSERIVIWNVATGAINADFELPNPEQRKRDLTSSKASLQWFPDGKRLLLNGQYIVDRDSKSEVFAFNKPSLDFHTLVNRRVLSDTAIAAWEGNNKAAVISPLVVKSEDIARAKEVAAAGGLMFDAKLPKLTSFDRSKAAIRPPADGAWKGTADPAGAVAKLADTLPIKGDAGRCREIEFSRPDVGVVGIRMSEEEDVSQAAISGLIPQSHLITGNNRQRTRIRIPPVPCRKNSIDLYDATKQGAVVRIAVDFPCELMAVSPDGKRVLVQAIDGEGRLDVFGADGQHVAGCRPFQNEEERKERDIASAVFLDANTVAACSIDDHLIVYKLPGCEPVYAVDDAGTIALSPGGKFIATCAEHKVELRDALSGESRGSVSLEADVQALSFSPKGDRLAVLTVGHSGTSVVVVDMATGSTTPVPTPQGTAPLVWCGDDEILLGGPSPTDLVNTREGASVLRVLQLVDLKRKAVLWSYVHGSQDNVTFGRKTFDGRFWLAGSPAVGQGGQIKAQPLPGPAAAKLAEGKKFDAQLLVKPGSAVGLKVNFATPPAIPGYADKARAFIDGAVKNNELKVQDDAPVKLVATISLGPVMGNMTLQALGGGRGGPKPPDITVQRKAVAVRVAYEAAGKTVWESKHDVSNDFFGITRLPEGKDAQTVLDEQMWQRALSMLERNLPPTHIFSPESARGLGASRLTGTGFQPLGK